MKSSARTNGTRVRQSWSGAHGVAASRRASGVLRARGIDRVLGVGASIALTLAAASARAEIRLLEPAPRYFTSQDSCPCGAGNSAGTCNVEQDGSDDARSSRVSRFEVGETITVRLDEYFDEAGRFRVAFDPSGADMEDFNANVLLDVADILDFRDAERELTIELPDTPCTNCTLQVVQIANGITDRVVEDPSPFRSFYACADLELVLPGTPAPDETEPPSEPPFASADAGGLAPSEPEVTTGAAGVPQMDEVGQEPLEPSVESQGGAGTMTPDLAEEQTLRNAGNDTSGGCSLHPGLRPERNFQWFLLLLATATLRPARRRRRR